ncbi:Formyltransferase [Phlebopus sp. FC_14]|nr:Formyltransferase [Phlebopus sp. FC_14]
MHASRLYSNKVRVQCFASSRSLRCGSSFTGGTSIQLSPHKYTQRRSFRTTRLQSLNHRSDDSRSTARPAREPFRILFCGRDLFSCAVFRELHKAKDVWNNIYIATNPDLKVGRNRSRLDISPLKLLGEQLRVPVDTIPKEKAAFKHWLPPPPFSSITSPTSLPSSDHPKRDSISTQNSSHLLITASFGRILPTSILRLFPEMQRLNVHPSLLPAYRGPAPIQRALMAEERETGVCVIEMGEVSRKEGKVVDEGGLWAVEKMNIPHNATFLDMQDRLAESGGNLLVQVLRDMLSGSAYRKPQDPLTANTPHASAITALDSTIVFASQSAYTVARLERAIGHQRALTVPAGLPDGRAVALAGLHVASPEMHPPKYIQQMSEVRPGATVYSPRTKNLLVACAGGEWLSVERLQTQDRAMVQAREWWNGIKGMGWVNDGRFQFG